MAAPKQILLSAGGFPRGAGSAAPLLTEPGASWASSCSRAGCRRGALAAHAVPSEAPRAAQTDLPLSNFSHRTYVIGDVLKENFRVCIFLLVCCSALKKYSLCEVYPYLWALSQFDWASHAWPTLSLSSALNLSASPKHMHDACFLNTGDVMPAIWPTSHLTSVGCWVLSSLPTSLTWLKTYSVAKLFYFAAFCLVAGQDIIDHTPLNAAWGVVCLLWDAGVLSAGTQDLCRGILHPVLVLGSAVHMAASSSAAQPSRARPAESNIWQEKGNSGQA